MARGQEFLRLRTPMVHTAHSIPEREELYQLAWSTPMIQLCQRFGISDQGLRKICKKQQVPLPVAGHWAKVAAGKKIVQPLLRPFSVADEQTRRARAGRVPGRGVKPS